MWKPLPPMVLPTLILVCAEAGPLSINAARAMMAAVIMAFAPTDLPTRKMVLIEALLSLRLSSDFAGNTNYLQKAAKAREFQVMPRAGRLFGRDRKSVV